MRQRSAIARNDPNPQTAPAKLRTRRELPARIKDETGVIVSFRTLERWPLRTWRIAGRAYHDEAEVIAHARRLIAAAPALRTGHGSPAEAA